MAQPFPPSEMPFLGLPRWRNEHYKKQYQPIMPWYLRKRWQLECLNDTLMRETDPTWVFLDALTELVVAVEPLTHTDRSIEELWFGLTHAVPAWNVEMWETFLRRNYRPPATMSFVVDNMLALLPHPEYGVSLYDLAEFYHSPETLRQSRLLNIYALFTFVRSDERAQYERIVKMQTRITSVFTTHHELERIFLKPLLTSNKHSHMGAVANKPAIVSVMRQYVSLQAFWEDLDTEDRLFVRAQALPFVTSRASSSSFVEAFVMEETALMIELALRYYLVGENAHLFDECLVVARNNVSCYLLGTRVAIQTLRYLFMPHMFVEQYGQQQQQSTTTVTKAMSEMGMFVHIKPQYFTLIYRAWCDVFHVSQDSPDHLRHVTQQPAVRAQGARMVVFTLVKWCYLLGHKNLSNTWLVDNKTHSDYNHLRWSTDMEHAWGCYLNYSTEQHMLRYHAQLFTLLTIGWPTVMLLETAIYDAAQALPSIDDYLAPRISLFAVIESFVFPGAAHAVRRETLEWLLTILDPPATTTTTTVNSTPDEIHAAARYKNLRAAFYHPEWFVACCRSYLSIAPAPLDGDSEDQILWDRDFAVLNKHDPRTRIFVMLYYGMIQLPHWTTEEAQRLLQTMRLAPNHRLLSLALIESYNNVAAAAAAAEEESEEGGGNGAGSTSLLSSNDENSLALLQLRELQEMARKTGIVVPALQESIAQLMQQIGGGGSDPHPTAEDGDDDDDSSSVTDGGSEQSFSIGASDDFSQSTGGDDQRLETANRKRARIYKFHNERARKRARLGEEPDDSSSNTTAALRTRTKANILRYINVHSNYVKLYNQMILKTSLCPPAAEQPNIELDYYNATVTLAQRHNELAFFATLDQCMRVRSASDVTQRPAIAVSELFEQFATRNYFVGHTGYDKAPSGLESRRFIATTYKRFHDTHASMCATLMPKKARFFEMMHVKNIRMFFDNELFYIPSTVHRMLRGYEPGTSHRMLFELLYGSTLAKTHLYDRAQQCMPSSLPRATFEQLAVAAMPPPPPKGAKRKQPAGAAKVLKWHY